MHRPDHFKLAPTVADARSVQVATAAAAASYAASGGSNHCVTRAYLELLKAGPDAFNLKIDTDEPKPTSNHSSGSKQGLRSKLMGRDESGRKSGMLLKTVKQDGEKVASSSEATEAAGGPRLDGSLPGRCMDLPGRCMDLPGRCMDLPGRCMDLPGTVVKKTYQGRDISESCARGEEDVVIMSKCIASEQDKQMRGAHIGTMLGMPARNVENKGIGDGRHPSTPMLLDEVSGDDDDVVGYRLDYAGECRGRRSWLVFSRREVLFTGSVVDD
jgi:hypothetical protein